VAISAAAPRQLGGVEERGLIGSALLDADGGVGSGQILVTQEAADALGLDEPTLADLQPQVRCSHAMPPVRCRRRCPPG